MMWPDVQDYSVTIASPCPPSLNPKAVRQVRDHRMLEFVHLPSVTTGKSSSFSAFHTHPLVGVLWGEESVVSPPSLSGLPESKLCL